MILFVNVREDIEIELALWLELMLIVAKFWTVSSLIVQLSM